MKKLAVFGIAVMFFLGIQERAADGKRIIQTAKAADGEPSLAIDKKPDKAQCQELEDIGHKLHQMADSLDLNCSGSTCLWNVIHSFSAYYEANCSCKTCPLHL